MMGAQERRRREANDTVALAHSTASFTRAKKLEALPHYLRRPADADRRSMLDRLKAISARTKG